MTAQNETKSKALLSRLKWLSALVLLGGAILVTGVLLAFMQGLALSGPDLVLAAMGAGLLLSSAWKLLPANAKNLRLRLTALDKLSVEQRRSRTKVLARPLIVISFGILLPEIALALALWEYREWQPVLVGITMTTLLFLGLFSLVLGWTRVSRSP